MSRIVNHYINGCVTETASNHLQPLYNPASGELVSKVSMGTEQDVNKAVQAAQFAFNTWSQTPIARRTQILLNYQALLKQHIDELAKIITQEHGKSLIDARGSIQRGIDVVEFACGISSHLSSHFHENVGTNVDIYAIRQPLGVCVGITPFNFPAMIPLWMFPTAVACGNTFVLKPSEKDPSCALRLAELFTEAGGPSGVVNVVNGDKTVVDALLHHPEVKAVSFVGSSTVAKYVYTTATAQAKRAQAFGSAKNHGVVMPDAPLEATLNALFSAAYGSTGQRCMALAVVVAVGDEIADQLIEGLVKRIQALKVGPGDAPETEMGPMVDAASVQRVTTYLELGVKEKATLVVDGRTWSFSQYPQGHFMGPSLFDHVKPHMRIYQEEIFGPVLCLVRVPDFAAAIQLVNIHPYGNGAAIFTQNGHAARTFASQVQAGMVGINVPIPVPVAYHNFGGWKQSVFGDTHLHGPESIDFYTKRKTITSRWIIDEKTSHRLAMPTLV